MLANSPYLTKRVPASHRGRISGISEVMRTGLTSLYQLLIGFIYGSGSSKAAWAAVLAFGVCFAALCVVLAVKDRKVYGNLYV